MDEQVLIARLADRDEAAFRWLVERYQNKIYALVLSLLQDSVEAEEAAQDVFIQVFRSIGSFRSQSTLGTWLYKIAVRKSLDRLRKKKVRQKVGQVFPGLFNYERDHYESDFLNPGISLENKERTTVFFKAIEKLPVKQNIAFTTVKIHGLSYKEASLLMDLNIKAVESLVMRAKVNLQKYLEHYYHS